MSAVHLAAGCGQLNCLSFLTNFGANIWTLNNDGRTPLEEAALHSRMDCVRHLDGLVAIQKIQNKKRVDRLQRQAQKDAVKRIRKEEKMKAEREKAYERRVSKETRERSKSENSYRGDSYRDRRVSRNRSDEWMVKNQKNGTLSIKGEKPFSELAGVICEDDSLVGPRSIRSKSDTVSSKSTLLGTIRSKFSTLRGRTSATPAEPRLIKQTSIDSGLRSFRSHSVPSDLDSVESKVVLNQHVSQDHLDNSDNNDSAGFAHMTRKFYDRGNASTQMHYMPKRSPRLRNGSVASRVSRGSHFSYSASDLLSLGSTELEDSFSDVVLESPEVKCLITFLSSLNLEQFAVPLIKESIDLGALGLLSDEDLQSLGLPLGPRRKILEAMKNRNAVLENPGSLRDSKI